MAKLLAKIGLRFYSRIFKKQYGVAKAISRMIYFLFIVSGVFLALEILGSVSAPIKLQAGAGSSYRGGFCL
ncbi:MAG: hypothetical protein AAGA86_08110 [Bacteroidota bacterium]